MKLIIFILRLLAAVAISGQWVIPADSLGKELKINHPPDIDHAISATDKTPNEKSDQEVLPNDSVSSKVIPRSAFDIKDLVKILKIAYTSNESQPLNHYELPDEESVKRDFRQVKMDNVDAESQKEGFSSPPLVSKSTKNAEVHKITYSVPPKIGQPPYANANIFKELVSEVDEVSDAMVYTVKSFLSSLKHKFETLSSKGLDFDNTIHIDMIFAYFLCCVCLFLLFHIFYNTLVTLIYNFESLHCEEGNNSYTMRKSYLMKCLENDNSISQIEIHDKEDDFNAEIKKDDIVACLYPPLDDTINEVLKEEQGK